MLYLLRQKATTLSSVLNLKWHKRQNNPTRELATKVNNMLALILLMLRSGLRESSNLSETRVLTQNIHLNTLTLLVVNSHRPNTNLQLDDLALGDLLNFIMRVERELRVDGPTGVDLALGSAENTHGTVVQGETLTVFVGDFVD
jgi:hypothetical protein